MVKPDSFVMLAALMSDKLVQMENTIADLNSHISDDHAQMDEMQNTITDLRRQLEARYDELNRLRQQAGDAAYYEQKVRQLEADNAQLRMKVDPEINERVESYMKTTGVYLWLKGEKIACIKGVRDATRMNSSLPPWGLKETKDFCESYDYQSYIIADVKKAEQETDTFLHEQEGPHTLRSSQQVKAG